MDTEQQVRLNFLEEVEDYFDQIETVALGMASSPVEGAELDRAMRAAHSVKGGAAMMGFTTLSKVAHRLEDFFKILRVRGDSIVLTNQIESLFLRGIDTLRLIGQHSRRGAAIDESFIQAHIDPVFDDLRSYLGDLRPEDEDRLLAQEENVDVATIIFSSGVEDCLEQFQTEIETLQPEQLRQALLDTSTQLGEFGRVSELATFVQLCEFVQAHIPLIKTASIVDFACLALATWKRSHALVLIGHTQNLPQDFALTEDWLGEASTPSPAAADATQPALSDVELPDESLDLSAFDSLDETDVLGLQDFVGDFGEARSESLDTDFNLDTVDDLALSELDSAFAEADGLDWGTDDIAQIDDDAVSVDPGDTADTMAQSRSESPLSDLATSHETSPETELDAAIPTSSALFDTASSDEDDTLTSPQQTTTVRVAAEQLQQLNALFGELIVERNAVNLRLSQLRNFVALMQERMGQLEASNQQLRSWYDRASTEGLIAPTAASAAMPAIATSTPDTALAMASPQASATAINQFDTLEFDRYTDLHVLSQEQMERIVQLQEVSNDITLTLREATTATADLHYTTRALQTGMAQMQMRPFSTLVKRFPRVVRDLALQYDKQVKLSVEGEMTLIDRVAVEALADPLNHLLRNAFDHGIESPEERLAAGKPMEGTISIRATHRGNQTIITVHDDGRGIDPTKILQRLRRLSLAKTELPSLEESDLYDLIFEPGFSTAEQVTELSGRGVGMDVVRTNLKKIRGDIRVDTKLGQGTTFTIQVPLAVSVLRVMVVESARFVFAVPIDSIQAMVDMPEAVPGDRPTSLIWNDQTVDLIHPHNGLAFNSPGRLLEMEGTPTINQPTVLLVNQSGETQGLCIDRFWGEQEISLNSVKSPIQLPDYFTGTSILGDGRVIPLVDPAQLLVWMRQQQQSPARTPKSAVSRQTAASPSTLALKSQVSSGDRTKEWPVEQLPQLLIVDDSINVRRYLALTLEKAGYQVEQAKDGQEAVDKLLAGLSVDAVVCDIEMPKLDGYGVLSELRSRSEYATLPIAMLTSRMNEKHRKLAMNLGASAYFSKPYNEQELLKTLETLMKTSAR